MVYAGATSTIGERGADADVRGRLTTLGGAEVYRVDAFDRIPAFLMSIVSESDLWMFISSSGGLTAAPWP